MDQGSLDLARAQQGVNSTGPAEKNSERVFKMFNDAERAEIIKNEHAVVKIGSGSEQREMVIRPLTPRGVLEAYRMISTIILPVIELYSPKNGEAPKRSFGEVLVSLGEHIDDIPDLVTLILKRGNDVSKDWIMDHMDFMLDMQVIIPIFIKQNGLDKMFAGKGTASAGPTLVEDSSLAQPPSTEA